MVERVEKWTPQRLQDSYRGIAGGRFLFNLPAGRQRIEKMRPGPTRDLLLALLDDAELAVRNK